MDGLDINRMYFEKHQRQLAAERSPSMNESIAELTRLGYRIIFYPYGEGIGVQINPHVATKPGECWTQRQQSGYP